MTRQGKLEAPASPRGSLTAGGEFVRWLAAPGYGTRVIAKGTGGADADIQVYGTAKDSDDPLDWYPLGAPMVFAADGSQTVYVDEPNTWLVARADALVAGSFEVETQVMS
jgi:hypothetical protein